MEGPGGAVPGVAVAVVVAVVVVVVVLVVGLVVVMLLVAGEMVWIMLHVGGRAGGGRGGGRGSRGGRGVGRGRWCGGCSICSGRGGGRGRSWWSWWWWCSWCWRRSWWLWRRLRGGLLASRRSALSNISTSPFLEGSADLPRPPNSHPLAKGAACEGDLFIPEGEWPRRRPPSGRRTGDAPLGWPPSQRRTRQRTTMRGRHWCSRGQQAASAADAQATHGRRMRENPGGAGHAGRSIRPSQDNHGTTIGTTSGQASGQPERNHGIFTGTTAGQAGESRDNYGATAGQQPQDNHGTTTGQPPRTPRPPGGNLSSPRLA